MTDYQKCNKLISYNKKQAKQLKKTNIIFICLTLFEFIIALCSLLFEETETIDTSDNSSFNLFAVSALCLFLGTVFTISGFTPYFHTKMLLHTPLRKYAITKFMPMKYFMGSLSKSAVCLAVGIIVNIFIPGTGKLINLAMVNVSLFIGISFSLSEACNKCTYLFIPNTLLLTFLYIGRFFGIIKLSFLDGLNDIAALVIGFFISVMISFLFSLLAYLINLALYKKPFSKVGAKYQEAMT